MAYNSTHTGANIDEAITFVLNTLKNLFTVSTSDNDKFLKVVNGTPTWVTIQDAEEVSF